MMTSPNDSMLVLSTPPPPPPVVAPLIVAVERVKFFNTTLVALEARVVLRGRTREDHDDDDNQDDPSGQRRRHQRRRTLPSSSSASSSLLLLTHNEPCTVVVRNRDQLHTLRQFFLRTATGTSTAAAAEAEDSRTLGWMDCGLHPHNNNHNKKMTKKQRKQQKKMTKENKKYVSRNNNDGDDDDGHENEIGHGPDQLNNDEDPSLSSPPPLPPPLPPLPLPTQTMTIVSCHIVVTTAIERNRRGRKMLECSQLVDLRREVDQDELLEMMMITAAPTNDQPQPQDDEKDSTTTTNNNNNNTIWYDKTHRHRLFAAWLVKTFGPARLASGTGVLDVAGGKGELGSILRDEYQIPSILLDPLPRCPRDSSLPFPTTLIQRPLIGDGTLIMEEDDRMAHLLQHSSMMTGMHPDQATEAIVDTAMRLGKPFAILPCCVMPKLFPHRLQKRHNQPVRSHSTFCQYLMDKAPPGCTFQVHHLPFNGRNKVIYFDFQCSSTVTQTT